MSPMCDLLLFLLVVTVKGDDVLVTVQQGTLRGTTATSGYNTSYTAFLGIPYAEPPVGDLRFQPPQPATGWEGVRDATQYGSDCVQNTGEGSEDCLYLNVYVPGLPHEGSGLPVLFYVHGGGFIKGSGSDQKFGPDFLVSYGVILVTINYRLGPLGFLSTGDDVVPGNVGLKDQLLGLSWVQSNIERFGGDPQRVTLDGRSAGGVAVSLHLMSRQTAGLFSHLVDQSGTFVAGMSVVPDPRYHAFRLGSVLGYEAENSQQLVQFLRSVNATDLLVDTSVLMTDEQKLYYSYSVWAPSIEPDIEGAFIRESPIRILNAGTFNKVPIMIGITSAEIGVSILNNSDVVANLNENFEAVVGPCLHLETTAEQTQAALELRNFYFGNETISLDDPEPLIHLSEDIDFFNPTDALVRRIVEVSDLPVYYYEFDYRGVNVPTNEWGEFKRRPYTKIQSATNPTPEADPVVWEPYDLSSRSYLLMQANFSLAYDRLGERMDFWNDNVPLEPSPGTY
ncbi:venom carboxylesterase-6-like [Schistocerca americana]|uniref:venom carboxylesterase-6-like n=1 Tax=Schistocerca americana TaxID=7009 RepID=UPI001F4F6CC1|nr:venom carboxylesterase-6-like [Schistocerca americana]